MAFREGGDGSRFCQSKCHFGGGDRSRGEAGSARRCVQHVYAMTGDEAHALASRCRLHLFSEGESIVREGERATAVHWIIAGQASVLQLTHREGRLALLELHPGEVVGEIAFLRQNLTPFTARRFRRARSPWSRRRTSRPFGTIRIWRARETGSSNASAGSPPSG